MQQYTLGFLFNSDLSQVLLVHKLAPPWQKGLLNGIGGKVEKGEEAIDCIIRETLEESSLKTTSSNWIRLGDLSAANWHVDVFVGKYSGDPSDARKADKETVGWFSTNSLPKLKIRNLSWLIPLAIDCLSEPHEFANVLTFTIRYS